MVNLTQIQKLLNEGEGLPCTFHYVERITPENLVPYSRNPVICRFMIQLGRFDQLGSGVNNINKYLPLYAKGAKPIFEETQHGFKLTIPLATEYAAEQVTQQATWQVTQQVEKLLLSCKGEMSRAELMKAVGIKDRVSFSKNYLEPALEEMLIEMTQPDSPKSPTQKYRITEKGKNLRRKNESND